VHALRARFRVCKRKPDEEQRHADAVVQPGFDVEPLADPRGQALVRDHRLPERGVCGSEDDREEQRLAEAERAVERVRESEACGDGERQPDPEQPKRDCVLLLQRGQVDPGRVREQHQREGRLGEQPDRLAVHADVDPAEPLASEQQTCGQEEDRRGDRGPVEAPRNQGVDDHDGRDDRQGPFGHRVGSGLRGDAAR
jgi:hypothetical protein